MPYPDPEPGEFIACGVMFAFCLAIVLAAPF